MQTGARAYPALDAIRGVAAALVVLWHLDKQLGFAPASGYLAVDLFFCLSGFVLAHAYQARLRTRRLGIARFALLRLVRLYPLYILGIVIAASVQLASHGWGSEAHRHWLGVTLAWSAAMLPTPWHYGRLIFPLNNVAWSLFFELAVNLLWAAIAPWVGKRALIAGIVLCGAGLVASVVSDGDLNHGGEWRSFAWAIPRVGYSFLVGIWLRHHPASRGLPLEVLLLASAGVIAIAPGASRAGYDLVAVLIGFPLLVHLGAATRVGPGAQRACALAGAMSYAVYMLHIPVFEAWQRGLLHWHYRSTAWPNNVALLATIALVSYAAHRWYDVPARHWLGRFATPVARRRSC